MVHYIPLVYCESNMKHTIEIRYKVILKITYKKNGPGSSVGIVTD